MDLVVSGEKHEETHRKHDNGTNNVRDQFRKLIYNFLWLLWIIWEAKREGSRSSANRANRHVCSGRARYLRKPVIKGSKDRRARIKLLPPNCSRDYRFVLPSRKQQRLCSTAKLEQPPHCISTSCENQRLIKYHGSARNACFTNFNFFWHSSLCQDIY